MPGVSKIKSQMDAAGLMKKLLLVNEAIILSMTKKERENQKLSMVLEKKELLMVLEQIRPLSINCLSNLK